MVGGHRMRETVRELCVKPGFWRGGKDGNENQVSNLEPPWKLQV